MNCHRSLTDFDQAWKSVDKLKIELQKTELKLQNAAYPNLVKTQANNCFSPVPNDGDNYLKERLSRKRKIYANLKGSHLFNQHGFDDLVPILRTNVGPLSHKHEDHPKIGYKQPSNETSAMEKSKYLTGGFLGEYVEASSFESSTSNSDIFSVHGAIESPVKINRDDQKIHFSRWEKEYLRKEVPELEVPDSSSIEPSQTSVKCPFSLSSVDSKMEHTFQLRQQINKLKNNDKLLKLKSMIERQSERNHRLISEIHVEPFVKIIAASNKIYVPKDDKVATVVTADASTSTKELHLKELEKLPTECVRKTATVPPPPGCKGFSHIRSLASPTNFEASTVSSPFKQKVLSQNVKFPTKLTKKVEDSPAKLKQNTAPCVWKPYGKYDVPPCVILNDTRKDNRIQKEQTHSKKDFGVQTAREELSVKDDVSPSSSEQGANILDSSTHETVNSTSDSTSEGVPSQVISSSKNDNKENDKPTSVENLRSIRKILEQISAHNDSEPENECISQDVKKNVRVKKNNWNSPPAKRPKQSKQPEQNLPAPKEIHYNREQIRKFMRKRNSLRKKRRQEEQQNYEMRQQTKKERFEQVIQKQKLVVRSFIKPKTSQPLKLLQENVKESECAKPVFSPKKKCSTTPSKSKNIPAVRTGKVATKPRQLPKCDTRHVLRITETDSLQMIHIMNEDIISEVSRTIVTPSVQSEMKSQEKFSNITEETESDVVCISKSLESLSIPSSSKESSKLTFDVVLPTLMEDISLKTSHNKRVVLPHLTEDSTSEVTNEADENVISVFQPESIPKQVLDNVEEDPPLVQLIKSLQVPLSPDSSESFVLKEGPLEDIQVDVSKQSENMNGNSILQNIGDGELKYKENAFIDNQSIHHSPLNEREYPKLDFNSSHFLKNDPYNFINAWNKKPLIFTSPLEEEPKTSSERRSASAPIALSANDNVYSTTFLESEYGTVSQHSKEAVEEKSESFINTVVKPYVERQFASHDSSTTIPSVISTDSQSFVSRLSDNSLDSDQIPEDINGDDDDHSSATIKNNTSPVHSTNETLKSLKSIEQASSLSRSQNVEFSESHKLVEQSKFSQETHSHKHSKSSSSIVYCQRNSKLSKDISSNDIVECIENSSSSASVKKTNSLSSRSRNSHTQSKKSIRSSSKKISQSPVSFNKNLLVSGESKSRPDAISETFREITQSISSIEHKMNLPVVVPFQQPLIDPQSITKVAAEAASAAATSAVIAALEYQKLLPRKKQLIEMMEKRISSPDNAYSSEFEKSVKSDTTLSSPHSSVTLHKKKKSKKITPSEQSIVEEIHQSNTSTGNEDNSGSHPSLSRSVVKSLRRANYQSPAHEKKGKHPENISSPSPASLSESDSLKSSSLSTTDSCVSDQHSDHYDPFSQLTLDMVKQRSREDERRARQQLMILECQERDLVKNAKLELKWLERLKRKLQEKKAYDKLPIITKRQQDYVLKVNEERSHLHRLQETYRNNCRRGHLLFREKRKLLTQPVTSTPSNAIGDPKDNGDFLASFDLQIENAFRSLSVSADTPVLDTSEDANVVDEVKSPDIPEMIGGSSSTATAIESHVSLASKSTRDSYGKSSKSQSSLSKSQKSSDSVASQANHSLQSQLQEMKKIETNKRYLVKKEQRLFQRRTNVESLMQWHKDLDIEEKKVKVLEKEAIQKIESSKAKSKYFLSSSTPASSKSEAESSNSHRTLYEKSVDHVPSQCSTEGWNVSEEIQTLNDTQSGTDSVPTASDVNKDLEGTSSKDKSGKHSNSMIDKMKKAREDSASFIAEEIDTHKSRPRDQTDNADSYSDTFNSSSTTPESHVQSKRKISLKKCLDATSRSFFTSPRHRRHDSSGSDDSLTISHSETASDQSDIEGRIYALTEEVNRRKAVADKLRGKHQKKQSDQLKETEISLKKQLEAYDKFIDEANMELEQQLEAACSPESANQTVKPQIKQPRVAKSRQLQKQSQSSTEYPVIESKVEAGDSAAMGKEAPIELKERKFQLHLAKKLQVTETKEITEDISSQSSSVTSKTNDFSASPELNTSKSRHSSEEKESIHSQSGNSESSLSYSSDFVMASSKDNSVKSHVESFHSKSDSIEEDIEEPPEEFESFSEDSEAPNIAKRSSSVTSTDSSESTIAEEKCSGSNGCSPRKSHEIASVSPTTDRQHFVENVVNDVMKSLFQESVSQVFNLLSKSEIVKPLEPKVSTSLTDIHKDVASKLTDDIIDSLVEDSVSNVVGILVSSDMSDSETQIVETKSHGSSTVEDLHLPQSESKSEGEGSQTSAFFSSEVGHLQNQKSFEITPHQDWFSESVYSTSKTASPQTPLSPLDQQLLVRQYPYFYRQIPNKPPPPYTPPSSSAGKPESEPVVEKINTVEEITNRIDIEVDSCLTTIFEGKKKGLMIEDIETPSTDSTLASLKEQAVFRAFLFDLTKELTLKLFVEKENAVETYKPWLRNQKLTSKPILPLEKSQVLPKVLREVKNILKINISKEDPSILSAMKLGRKKRDFVDTIIIGELKEEEPDWINYDEDEFQVKLQLTDSIFDLLFDDAFKHMFSLMTRRRKPCT